MKTLAEFKRLAVIGACFRRTFVDNIGANGKEAPPMLRIVNHAQCNAVAFRVDNNNPSTQNNNRAWLYLDEPRYRRFEDGKLVFLSHDGSPRMIIEYLGSSENEIKGVA